MGYVMPRTMIRQGQVSTAKLTLERMQQLVSDALAKTPSEGYDPRAAAVTLIEDWISAGYLSPQDSQSLISLLPPRVK